MEQTNENGPAATPLQPLSGAEGIMAAQSCPTCAAPDALAGAPAPSYVYAIGQIEPRFPTRSIEKEFAQVAARHDLKGLTDRQSLHAALNKPENRYLLRQLCWVMNIAGLETYILAPRDPVDLHLLAAAIRPRQSRSDFDVVIGVKGPIAPAEICNGLMVPIVGYDQIYSFDRATLIQSIPRPRDAPENYDAAAEELFERIIQITDNAGATDEHRALNYLAMRYNGIYAQTADAFLRNCSLSAVDVKISNLSGVRKIMDVILSYTYRCNRKILGAGRCLGAISFSRLEDHTVL